MSSYLRYPHITGDHIVFVADDDVWMVDAGGGRAERLTADRVPAARPRLSPDATLLAWSSARDGNNEVYVTPVAGGEATRLTYWDHANTRVLGWSGDGRVIVSTPALQPFRTQSWAYALPIDGGPGERLPLGPVSGLARRPRRHDRAAVGRAPRARHVEALPRRHPPEAVDRPGRIRGVRAAARRARRPAGRSGLARRPARVRLRPRGPRQRLLGAGRRQRPAPAQRPHRQLRARSGR